MGELLKNEYFIWIMISIIVLGLSQLLKLPIKWLTKKFCKNEFTRTRINTCIMFIPILLGIALDFIYSTYFLHTMFDVLHGWQTGGTAIFIYGMLETFFKGKKSKETVAQLELVGVVAKDGKIDAQDGEIIKDFLNNADKVQ